MTPLVSSPTRPKACPCGSGTSYTGCCGAFHEGRAVGDPTAPTAEQLMRSRYTAFALGDEAYLLATWDPTTRPPTLELEPELEWRSLRILGGSAGGVGDDEGTVEFVASFWDGAERQHGELREHSSFRRRRGQWFYVDAVA